MHVYVPYTDYCDGIRFKTPCIHTYTYIAYTYASSCHALICNVTFGFKRAPANRNRRRTRGLLKTIACTMRRAHMSGALKAGTARGSLSLSSSPRSLSLRPPTADVRRINIHYTTAAERIARGGEERWSCIRSSAKRKIVSLLLLLPPIVHKPDPSGIENKIHQNIITILHGENCGVWPK